MVVGNSKELIKFLIEQDNKKIYELREKKQKRSLDANAYYWVLLTKIADVLRTSKTDLHLQMLKEYGQITAICVPANFQIEGFIKYYEKDGVLKRGGKEFYTYKVFKPSSEMNSKEMAVLIDGVVNEAKLLEIETLPPEQLEQMKASYKVNDE